MEVSPAVTSEAAKHAEINQRIFENSLDLILVADSRGNLIRISPSSLTILGYDPSEMVGRSARTFVYPDDLDATRDEMRQARYGAMTRNFECRYVHKAGHPVTLWWTGQWSAPEHQYFFIGRDVTDRIEAERRVRRAEILLHDAVESISEGFVIYDDEDRMVMCNEAYRRFYAENAERDLIGIRFEDVLRQGVASGRYPQAAGREEAWIAERVRRHRDVADTMEQRVGDGRWVLVTKRRMANGWIAGLRIDVTALKSAQAALIESEARLALALETAGIGVAASETSTDPAAIDSPFRQIYGLPEEQSHIGVGEWLRLIHPEERDAVAADMLTTIRAGGQYRGEFRIRRDDTGEERWIRAATGVARDAAGNIGRFLGVHLDITESKHALEELRRTTEQLANAQRLAQMGSFMRDMRTDAAEWSDETYRILGVPPETYRPSTENFMRLVHPDDRALFNAKWAEVRRGVRPAPYEYRLIRPDGSLRHIYLETELILDTDGTPRRVAGTIHDVTERRNTEAQLRQAQKMEAIGNLTGGMAHDFNNLLGVIIGNLDLVPAHLEPRSEAAELVKEATGAALSGAELTRRLLAFARRQPLRPETVAPNNLITDVVRLLRRVLGEDIEIELDLAGDLWPVVADPAQLESALTNLATNARDAMPRGGRLTFATANRRLDADYAAAHAEVTAGDYAAIEITDTGAGMATDVVERIFEPFFTTKAAGKGTGLGLSMVFGFMKQSGGHINVYSEPGVGTTFRLYLPRAAAVKDSAGKEEPAVAVARGAGETVLAVEDNPSLRRIVMRQLRQLGYRALEADGAAAALELLDREKVHLLFSDIVMPGPTDGVALAQQAVRRWPGLKVVLTSGFPGTKLDEQMGPLGDAVRLLSKPYRTADLARLLRETLDG